MTETAAVSLPVLVAGATGRTGRHIVTSLQEQDYGVRALVRRAATPGPGVEAVVADVRRPDTLTAAMNGVGAVISAIGGRAPLGGNGFRAIDWEGNLALVEAAVAARVPRFILITAASAGRSGFPYSFPLAPYPWKARAEEFLRRSGLAWTILGPGGLNDEAAGQRGIRAVPRREYRQAWIARADLARVAVACLGAPGTIGRTITLVNDDSAPDAWRSALASLPVGGNQP